MSNLKEFSLFPQLPTEIRFMIWENTFTPRVLSACYPSTYPYNSNLMNMLRSCGISVGETPSEQEPPLISVSVEPIHTLSVCHESRDLGIRSGYKTWKLHNEKGCVKEVFWNPVFDAIAFFRPFVNNSTNWQSVRWIMEIFGLHFPSQAEEVRKVAFYTTSWSSVDTHNSPGFASALLPFESLEEIVLVLNKCGEREMVRQQRQQQRHSLPSEFEPLELPGDIETLLKEECQNIAPAGWKIPAVRVVGDENEILGKTSTQMVLRCFPCPDLGMDAEWNGKIFG